MYGWEHNIRYRDFIANSHYLDHTHMETVTFELSSYWDGVAQ